MQNIHPNVFSIILPLINNNPAFRPVQDSFNQQSAVMLSWICVSAFSGALLVSYQKRHVVDISLVLC